jgi:hypothetical protein
MTAAAWRLIGTARLARRASRGVAARCHAGRRDRRAVSPGRALRWGERRASRACHAARAACGRGLRGVAALR